MPSTIILVSTIWMSSAPSVTALNPCAARNSVSGEPKDCASISLKVLRWTMSALNRPGGGYFRNCWPASATSGQPRRSSAQGAGHLRDEQRLRRSAFGTPHSRTWGEPLPPKPQIGACISREKRECSPVWQMALSVSGHGESSGERGSVMIRNPTAGNSQGNGSVNPGHDNST